MSPSFEPRESIFGFSGPVARASAVAVLIAAVTVFFYSVPEHAEEWHRSRGLIQKMFFFPLLLAAAWFGARGAVAATAAATAVSGAMIVHSWPGEVGIQVERMGEVCVFWLVGGLAANFFEQQKKHVSSLEVANEKTLIALASALDAREHSTGLHSHRVADYTLRLAAEMGIADPTFLAMAWKGALLHDVGKIGIPDSVLLKPGPLSDREWVVMRSHPAVGEGLVRKIDFLQDPAQIVLSHHERFDGSGYPRGLKGEEIPLGARLFAVVDVYDAITTARSYREPTSHAEAIEILRQGAGVQYDPAVVEAFRRVPFEDWEEIARRNREVSPMQAIG